MIQIIDIDIEQTQSIVVGKMSMFVHFIQFIKSENEYCNYCINFLRDLQCYLNNIVS